MFFQTSKCIFLNMRNIKITFSVHYKISKILHKQLKMLYIMIFNRSKPTHVNWTDKTSNNFFEVLNIVSKLFKQ